MFDEEIWDSGRAMVLGAMNAVHGELERAAAAAMVA